MTENLLSLIVLVSPLAFIATAIASWFQPGKFPHLVKKLSMTSASLTLLIATYSGFLVYKYGLLQSGLLGFEKIGLAIRIDPLSILMFGMIALLGYVVLKFSLNYLDGDPRQVRSSVALPPPLPQYSCWCFLLIWACYSLPGY